MRYIVLERTPMPGYWQALALCWIQDAEYHLRFNKRHYYERAFVMGTYPDKLYMYQLQDANEIVRYWQAIRPFAEYKLLAYPVE